MTKTCNKCGVTLGKQEIETKTLAGRCWLCYYAHNPDNDPNESDLPSAGNEGQWRWRSKDNA